MFFQRLKTPGLGHNAYVMGCGDGLAVVVDPRRDVDDYLQLARRHGLSIVFVLQTHRQEDFEFGSRTLAQMTGALIVGGRHPFFGETDVTLEDDEQLTVGTTRFVALATPGHTPESVSYAVYVQDAGEQCWGVFSGDALFVGDTGRTDLSDPAMEGDHAGILYDAIHRKIAPLGGQALLFPAHGAGSACGGNISERDDSTLGIELRTNPVFRLSRPDFVAQKLSQKMARPPYFRHMEEVNLLPGRPLERMTGHRVLQPGEFQHRMAEGLVIDTRSPEAFAAAHIPGAYNVWLAGLPAFGGWIADRNTRIFLIADGADAVDLAVMSLARIGIDSVQGALANGMESWRDQGLPIATLETTSARETADWMRQRHVHVLDVRDTYEWDEKHIEGAVHCYVGHLEANLPLLPKDGDIVVHCNVGHRSGLAASILKRHGHSRVHNMLGGLTAWQRLGLPLERAGDAKEAD